MATKKELKKLQREQEKAEFELVKQAFIKEHNLQPVDSNHDDYYVDLERVKVYSFKNLKITDMKFGKTFGGYRNVCLVNNDGVQKAYNVSWIMYSSSRKIILCSWRNNENGEKGTIHHIDSNRENDFYLNLRLVTQKEQFDDNWKKARKEKGNTGRKKKFSDEFLQEMYETFLNSKLAITRFSTDFCHAYGIDPVHMYNILRGKSRKEVTK